MVIRSIFNQIIISEKISYKSVFISKFFEQEDNQIKINLIFYYNILVINCYKSLKLLKTL